MERCRTLQEYSQFVGIVREYAETQKLSDSVMAEILQKCRAENILKEFLEKYGTEVIGMFVRSADRGRGPGIVQTGRI